MADIVFLSLWLRDYSESNMLLHWRRVLEAFPYFAGLPGVRSITVHPLDWAETPVFERSFGEGATPEDAANLVAEFLHDDYAYEAEMAWDLWIPDASDEPGRNGLFLSAPGAGDEEEVEDEDSLGGDSDGPGSVARELLERSPVSPDGDGWRKTPIQVSISCMGPGFDSESSIDRPHILINFGLESPFMPVEEDLLADVDVDWELADVRARENLQQLIGFVHHLDETVPVSKRLLWCESGENLAEKILDAWDMRL